MKLSDLHHMSVAVWGGGRDGRAATEQCLAQKCTVTVISDSPESDTSAQELASQYSLPLLAPSRLAATPIDFIVRSPGVSRYRQDLHDLAQRGIHSSNLFALWLADQPAHKIVGVTGTKGKSTTATVIEKILLSSGKSVALVGNIGVPVTQVDPSVDCVVVEVSSYQASDCTTSPEVGVLTTLGEDHITWHGSLQQYHVDKMNLFAYPQLKKMVFHSDDPTVVDALRRSSADQKYFISPFDIDDIVNDNRAAGVLSRMGETTFPRNLELAIHAAYAIHPGLTTQHIVDALDDVAPLPSRQNIVGKVNGIECIDDALASNPLAAISAIERFSDAPMILIVGGQDRNVDYTDFIDAVNHAGNVRHVIVMGDTNNSFAERVAPALPRGKRSLDDSIEIAVQQAFQLAQPGWRIVFSPAAPTPPHLGDYTVRSNAFRRAVEEASSLF